MDAHTTPSTCNATTVVVRGLVVTPSTPIYATTTPTLYGAAMLWDTLSLLERVHCSTRGHASSSTRVRDLYVLYYGVTLLHGSNVSLRLHYIYVHASNVLGIPRSVVLLTYTALRWKSTSSSKCM